MKTNYHYILNGEHNDPNRTLASLLQKRKIKFFDGAIYAFDLQDDMEDFSSLHKIITERYKATFTQNVIYYKAEIKNAPYLHVFVKSYQGNFNDDERVYDMKNVCNVCGHGRIQKDLFSFSANKFIGNKKIGSMFNLYDELFVSKELKDAIEDAGLTGCSFKNVYKKNGINDFIYQLVFEDLFPFELEFTTKKEFFCEACKTQKYVKDGSSVMRYKDTGNISLEKDFYKSSEFFGDMKCCVRQMIISHKAFELFEKLKIKNLNYEPIFFK